jgi:LysR family nitrogen assimilation transcriptional regulator
MYTRTVNIRRLVQFTTVANAGSITEAAKRLHIAQPALSHALKDLERDLGVKLFERGRRGVTLTDSGKVALEHAKTVLRQIEYLREAVVETEQNPSGSVSLALPASVAHVLSKPVGEAVLSELPLVSLSLDEGLTGDLARSLRSGRIDLMIHFDVEFDDEYLAEPLIREELFLFGRDIGGRGDISMADASNFPIFLPGPQHAMGRAIARFERENNRHFTRVPLEAGVHPMLALVEAGRGTAILPWSLIHDRVDKNGLTARRITSPSVSRSAFLVTLQSRLQTPASKAVAEIVRNAVSIAHKQGLWRGELLV